MQYGVSVLPRTLGASLIFEPWHCCGLVFHWHSVNGMEAESDRSGSSLANASNRIHYGGKGPEVVFSRHMGAASPPGPRHSIAAPNKIRVLVARP